MGIIKDNNPAVRRKLIEFFENEKIEMIHYCARPQEALLSLLGNLSMHNG